MSTEATIKHCCAPALHYMRHARRARKINRVSGQQGVRCRGTLMTCLTVQATDQASGGEPQGDSYVREAHGATASYRVGRIKFFFAIPRAQDLLHFFGLAVQPCQAQWGDAGGCGNKRNHRRFPRHAGIVRCRREPPLPRATTRPVHTPRRQQTETLSRLQP